MASNILLMQIFYQILMSKAANLEDFYLGIFGTNYFINYIKIILQKLIKSLCKDIKISQPDFKIK